MPLKHDLSEEVIWGPQNILITPLILLCYYHNYPFAPVVLIRNSPSAPRGGKRTWVGEGENVELGKGISQLLPYALWSGRNKREWDTAEGSGTFPPFLSPPPFPFLYSDTSTSVSSSTSPLSRSGLFLTFC